MERVDQAPTEQLPVGVMGGVAMGNDSPGESISGESCSGLAPLISTPVAACSASPLRTLPRTWTPASSVTSPFAPTSPVRPLLLVAL
jgi:hypothetical protein